MSKIQNWCEAATYEAWSHGMLGLRLPLLHIVCGHCGAPSKSRNWKPVTNQDNRIAGYCPRCGYWNLTGLVYG